MLANSFILNINGGIFGVRCAPSLMLAVYKSLARKTLHHVICRLDFSVVPIVEELSSR
jgi:hypothetical protein